MKAGKTRLIAAGAVFVIAVAVFVAGRSRESSKGDATTRFKRAAAEEVARLTTELSAVSNQVMAMASLADEEDKWLSQRLIVMKSGEWVVFVSKCSKEDPKIRDTFVCRASNGRWSYESNFHFCKGVIVLRMEGQPLDLQSFIADHQLSELRGQPSSAPN